MPYYSALISAVFLAPACGVFGVLATKVRLPSITGFLFAGVLAGPHVFNLLTSESLPRLWFIDQICLSVIALAAGAELKWENLERTQRQVWLITMGIASSTWLVIFITMLALSPYIPFTSFMNLQQLYVVCSLCATLMIARSPASAIAVLQESGGKGPFCSLVLTVVIVKDVLTIVLFSLNIEMARVLFSPGHPHVSVLAFTKPLVSVLVAISLGAASSYVMEAAMRTVSAAHKVPKAVKMALVVIGAFSTFEAAAQLDAEPLLACAISGLLTSNRMPDAGQEDFLNMLQAILPKVNLAFFSLAGAALRLGSFHSTLLLASVLFAARVLAVYAGGVLGCSLSGTPAAYSKSMWQTMLTQAGVALGLTRMAGVRFPHWGSDFQTLMATVIVANLIIGPPLFRAAIVSIGESRVEAHSHSKSAAQSPTEAVSSSTPV